MNLREAKNPKKESHAYYKKEVGGDPCVQQHEHEIEDNNNVQNAESNMEEEQAQDREQKPPVTVNERDNKELANVASQASQGPVTTKKQVGKEAAAENALIVWEQEELNEVARE
ncbi:hypothetical protein HAX54_025709 [Datura stramonium]|uniref:Uncharacterized protein n=1 Tax=Datura stramonium TaxID=4076 RepID=A0ABS8V1K2_DATST|nr:hypothetical protein [Datura stramonium]